MTVTDKNNESPVAAGKTLLHAINIIPSGTEEQVNKIIMEKLGLEKAQIKPGASFTDDLGIDSLDVFELVIEIENVFHISIPSEEAEKLTTPGKLVDYIKSVTRDLPEDH